MIHFIPSCSRATLLQSIVLSGGSTLLKGFGDRLLSELKKVRSARVDGGQQATHSKQTAPHGTKLRITASPERQCVASLLLRAGCPLIQPVTRGLRRAAGTRHG